MRYQLFYRQQLIATVEETNSEFPSCFGHYRLEPIADVAELAHVQAYIDFCVRVSPLREQERFDDPALAEEVSFTDLIESTAVAAAVAIHVASRRWLSFFR